MREKIRQGIVTLHGARRSVACVLAAGFTVLICFGFQPNDATAAIDALLIWAVLMAITLLFYIKGVPAAAAAVTFIGVLAVLILASVWIEQAIPGEAPYIWLLTGGLFLAQMTYVPLPRLIFKKLRHTVEPEMAASGGGEEDRVTYRDFLARKPRRYFDRPYALAKNGTTNCTRRVILTVIAFVVFFVAMLVLDGIMATAGSPAKQRLIEACIAVACFGMGLSIVYLAVGALRTLIVAGAAAVLIGVVVLVFNFLREVFQQSPTDFVLYTMLFALLTGGLCAALYNIYFRRSVLLRYFYFDKNQGGARVDCALENVNSIVEYTKLTRCTAVFTAWDGIRADDDILVRLTALAARFRFVFCGYVGLPENETLTFVYYIYAKTDCTKAVERVLSRFKTTTLRTACYEDADWFRVAAELFPDRYERQWIANRNFVAHLNKIKYDFNKPVHLVYFLLFLWQEDAHRCCCAAEEGGYVRALCENNLENVAEFDLPWHFAHVVHIENKCPAGLLHLNAQTVKIVDLAERYNGVYHQFFTVEPEG